MSRKFSDKMYASGKFSYIFHDAFKDRKRDLYGRPKRMKAPSGTVVVTLEIDLLQIKLFSI